MLPYKSFMSWDIGFVTIQSFGVMFALGFLAAVWVLMKQLKTVEQKEHANNLTILAIVSGLIGARVVHVIQFWSQGYYQSFWDIVNLWSGGLAWFGGFVGGVLGVLFYVKWKKLDFWKWADRAAPAIALGHAIGRIGCILGDGGHVGKLTNMPWGFNIDGEIRHVTAWYSMINLFVLFVLLKKLGKKKPFKGALFVFYLGYYGITRFVIDIFRIDPRYYGLTMSQYFCIGLVIVSFILYRRLNNH